MKAKKKAIILFSVCLVILVGAFIGDRIIANSHLVKIKYEEVIEKIEDEESFVLLISQTECTHCKSYKPKLRKIAREYDLTVYYIDVDVLSKEEQKEFKSYISYSTTPSTVFLKKGKESTVATRIDGDKDKESILKKFKSNGFID